MADCEFDQLGGNAVFVNNYNRRVPIRGCYIHDSGGNGVAFVGDPKAVRNPLFEYGQRQDYATIDKTPGPQTDNYPADCIVEDCLITRIGRVEKQAAGVQISMAQGITVRHCSIYEMPRAGINISEGTFGGHVIEFCDVFDTVLETGDHGSFNSWGRDRFWGLKDAPAEELPQLALLDVVKPNILRNSRWRCDHGWDVDLDDGSSNYEIYNNLLPERRPQAARRLPPHGVQQHHRQQHAPSARLVRQQRRRGHAQHLHGRLPAGRRDACRQVGPGDRPQPVHHHRSGPHQVRRPRLRRALARRRPAVRRSRTGRLSRAGRLARACSSASRISRWTSSACRRRS